MIKAINHFGLTVDNIEEAVYFFRDILGLETTPIREIKEREDIGSALQVSSVTIFVSDVHIPGNKAEIELLQYVVPQGHRVDIEIWNPGISHIAFEVDDIQKVYNELTARGVDFYSEPVWLQAGVYRGWRTCFLKGPAGIIVEIKQQPSTNRKVGS